MGRLNYYSRFILLVGGLFFCLSSAIGSVSIMQAATFDTKTLINVVRKNSQLLAYEIEPKANIKKSVSVVTREGQDYVVDLITLTQLTPDVKYSLVVKNQKNKIVDKRFFKTLVTKGEQFKYAVVSCAADYFKTEQKKAWESLASHNPEAVFMIGDNVYGNIVFNKLGVPKQYQQVPPKILWQRYIQTRNSLAFYRAKKLIPVFALWDDHDYGTKDLGTSYKFKKQSTEMFNAFFPRGFGDYYARQSDLGISYKIKLRGVDYYFLDARTFRDDSKNAKTRGQHISEAQQNWLLQAIKGSTSPGVIFKGDQFFGGYHPFESFEGSHPEHFKKFIKALAGLGPVVFMSGDRHLSEVMEIDPSVLGYKTYELTSSGIHSSVYPGSFKKYPSPRKVAGVDGKRNFVIVEQDLISTSKLSLNLSSFDENNIQLFTTKVQVVK